MSLNVYKMQHNWNLKVKTSEFQVPASCRWVVLHRRDQIKPSAPIDSGL